MITQQCLALQSTKNPCSTVNDTKYFSVTGNSDSISLTGSLHTVRNSEYPLSLHSSFQGTLNVHPLLCPFRTPHCYCASPTGSLLSSLPRLSEASNVRALRPPVRPSPVRGWEVFLPEGLLSNSLLDLNARSPGMLSIAPCAGNHYIPARTRHDAIISPCVFLAAIYGTGA